MNTDRIDHHSLLYTAVENNDPEERINELLAMCRDPECYTCGSIVCPHGEELHFHHEGCPACAEHEAAQKH